MSQLRPLQGLGPNEPVQFQLMTKEKKRSERKQFDPIALPAQVSWNQSKMNANSLVKNALTYGESKLRNNLAEIRIERMHLTPDRSQRFRLLKLWKPITSMFTAVSESYSAKKRAVFIIRNILNSHRTVKIFVESVIWVSSSKNILTNMWHMGMLITTWPKNNSTTYI